MGNRLSRRRLAPSSQREVRHATAPILPSMPPIATAQKYLKEQGLSECLANGISSRPPVS
jgi:hypothetical protein